MLYLPVTKQCVYISLVIISLFLTYSSCSSDQDSGKEIVLRLGPHQENPRNSEGDFIQLEDGRILFVYTHFTGGTSDHAAAYLTCRYSTDAGKTWSTDDVKVLSNEGAMNVMSVSLLRLDDGTIAMLYLRKNSETDCLPFIRISTDEGHTWSAAKRCIQMDGYHVVNNDRLVQLSNDRILFPASHHSTDSSKLDPRGRIFCYYSDDRGRTWSKSEQVANPNKVVLQEPGIVELNGGKLLLFCRTDAGFQYFSLSDDQGQSWSSIEPGNIKSPLSPASIERIPATGDLLLLWNNNYQPGRNGGKRTPYNLAVSKDEGNTWSKIKSVESDPSGWYCYTAIDFVDNHVLLGHCAGDTRIENGLARTHITRLSLEWIYREATPDPLVESESDGTVKLVCDDQLAQIFYTLDETYPTEETGLLYQQPIVVSGITPLHMQAFNQGKTPSQLVFAQVGVDIFLEAQEPIDAPIPGLTYRYYEGEISKSDEIEQISFVASGIAQNFSLAKSHRTENFAMTFNGYIKVPKDDTYTFYLKSNDGSVLYLDDHKLIDNDGAHGVAEKKALISLKSGMHKISARYFQLGGEKSLKLSWQSQYFDEMEVPSKVLFHEDSSFSDAVSWLEKEAHRIIRASMRTMEDGTAAFPPQVGIGYEAFWLRDYAYTLEGSIDSYSDKELLDACKLFVKNLSADGAGVDCIKFDGTPIYKPGFGTMGINPVADGSQFTIAVAWQTYQKTKDRKFLSTIIDALITTMKAVPLNAETQLVHIAPGKKQERCPYGFTDTIEKQGDLLFCSLLYFRACQQLADLLEALDRDNEASLLEDKSQLVLKNVGKTFWDSEIGLFRAATHQCKEPDIWGSAYAVYLGVANEEQSETIALYFQRNYKQIVTKGQVRHLPGGMHWEKASCAPDTYQNGAFWATPAGWFVYTLDIVDAKLANQTVVDMVNDFKKNGANEWISEDTYRLPNYLASASLPLDGISAMVKKRQE